MRGRERIRPRHLELPAVVYVRQSTAGQVRVNRESTRQQYRLREQAEQLGWAPERIEIVDEDLGVSGSGLERRPGFARMTRQVARGRVGAVFGLDATRLARNTADWFDLLRWLELTDTLLVEDGQVYDLASGDDSFLLAIKGSVSARERYMTAKRMQSAKRQKAERGELYGSVPVGYVLQGRRLRRDPDERVRHAVRQVFATFRAEGSARRAAWALREAGERLPAREGGRDGPLRWQAATYARVYELLTNPAMGGAYAWGRSRTVVRVDARGCPSKRRRVLPRGRWRVLLEDHHTGYVSWSEWLAIQDRLAANSFRTGRGAPREGRALLQGRVRCRRCGTKLQVRYGQGVQYCCVPSVEAGAKQVCQSASAGAVDAAVAAALLEAVRPASVDAAVRARRRAAEREEERLRGHRLDVERLEHEAEREEREYVKVEPEFRTLKRPLARRWERALKRLERAREELRRAEERAPRQVSPVAAEWFAGMAEDLDRLWKHPAVTMRDRKRLLGALLEEALLEGDWQAGRIRVLLRWKGGTVEDLEVPWRRPAVEPVRDDLRTLEVVRRLARHCGDARIARTLNRQGRRTARGLRFNARRVLALRQRHGVPACGRRPADGEGSLRSVPAAAAELGVSRSTVYRWLEQGFLSGEQPVAGAPVRVRIDDAVRERMCASAPEGFLPHAEALRRAGVARETLRQWILAGRCEVRWVARGPRKGLYVQLDQHGPPPGLFDGAGGSEADSGSEEGGHA